MITKRRLRKILNKRGKTIGAAILSAAFAVAGCQKEQIDAPVASNANA